MNTMNMPGFTAEASLDVAARTYLISDTFESAMGVIPSAFSGLGGIRNCIRSCHGDEGCIECCICVGRGGHPWQCCF